MVKSVGDQISNFLDSPNTVGPARRLQQLIVSKRQSGLPLDLQSLSPDQCKIIEDYLKYLKSEPSTPAIDDGGLLDATKDAILKIWPDGKLKGIPFKKRFYAVTKYLFESIGQRPSRSTVRRAFDDLRK